MSRASELAALLAADMADVDEVVAEMLRLERVNAELVEADLSDQQIDAALSVWFSDIEGFRTRMRLAIRAALTSATKEQQK